MILNSDIKLLLDDIVDKVNTKDFIELDPISIPHRFSKKQDIEIAAFFAAILAWGQRKTIINKTNELLNIMDNDPYNWMVGHTEDDRRPLMSFVHRTFQGVDALSFVAFLQSHYLQFQSLEQAFHPDSKADYSQESALNTFYQQFSTSIYVPTRTLKHVASPNKKSTCKRLNMLLRWMVRRDNKGVDFGLWTTIPMSELMIPLDVHVENYSRQFGLLTRKQRDWQSVVELTNVLKTFDPNDPVKYDYALFGLGVYGDKL